MPDFIIRAATLDDAEQTLDHLRKMKDERDNGILFGPDDVLRSLDDERKQLADFAAADNSVLLVADAAGIVIGVCSAKGGNRIASRGNVGIGISIDADWRGKGVGTALMQALIEWARGTGFIWRIELDVFTHNTRAIQLYQKLGFEIEGRRRKVYFKEGVLIDSFVMSLLLES
jgi:RimJ/RimL family protein N-acetyltransferase